MVGRNRGLPEPPETSTDGSLSPNNEIILVTDTDTDEEDEGYEGYQPLPVSPEEAMSSDSEGEEDAETVESDSPPVNSLPSIMSMEEALVQEVWSSVRPQDIEMDSSKVDAVREAMINVTLPPSSIPEWANSVPEDEWKATLMNRIQNINRSSKPTTH